MKRYFAVYKLLLTLAHYLLWLFYHCLGIYCAEIWRFLVLMGELVHRLQCSEIFYDSRVSTDRNNNISELSSAFCSLTIEGYFAMVWNFDTWYFFTS